MEPIARKADGRRIYTAEFKRQQVERVVRGEALSRKEPGKWQRAGDDLRASKDSCSAVQASGPP